MSKITVEQAMERLANNGGGSNGSSQNGMRMVRRAPVQIEFIKSLGENVFMFKKDGKYILSPADDELDPIMAELDDAPNDEDLPPCFVDWINGYNEEIENFQEGKNNIILEASAAGDFETVDLGLSVNWGTMNIGAKSPEENGDYYAWGETETKTNYVWKTYLYTIDSNTAKDIGESIAQNKEYDKAYLLDSNTCMPTEAQFQELIDNCTWTKTTLNGVTVWEAKGPNGNVIYFPLNGCKSNSDAVSYKNYAYVWTANNYPKNSLQARVFRITDAPNFYSMMRRTGAAIRPISYKKNEEEPVESGTYNMVDLGLTTKWSDKNVGATKDTEVGDYYAWGETKTKDSYLISNYEYYVPEKIVITGNLPKDIAKTAYDAAYAYDKALCMPTSTQIQELIKKCSITAAKVNNVSGYNIKGPSGNSIFLPNSGYKVTSDNYAGSRAYIWSSTLTNTSTLAYNLGILSATSKNLENTRRRAGLVIRPVASGEGTPSKNIKLVDLGLSVKWADMNVGATNSSEYGTYVSWGELQSKSTYDWPQYKYADYTPATYTNIGDNISKTRYDKPYMVDENACMPTEAQFQELMNYCKWTKTKKDNVDVWEVKGPNGNVIYFPIGGCISESSKVGYTDSVYCWTSDVYTKTNYQAKSFKVDNSPSIYNMYKRTGANIRPVSTVVSENQKKKTIDSFVPFKWGQTAPCNNMLPIDPKTGIQVVTGCPSTAISQVMAYWGCVGLDGKKYKRGCEKTTAYTSNKLGRTISIPALEPITVFNYSNFLYKKADINKSQEAKDAVAMIHKHVGYAIKTAYSSDSSSANTTTCTNVLKNQLRMGNNIKLILSSSGEEKWADAIYSNIEKKWPVIIAGWNKEGTGGHAFVCDGYNADTNKYHMNFGWYGNYDGWYTMSALNAGSYNFSYFKQAIINICPEYVLGDTNGDGIINVTDIMNIVNAIISEKFNDVDDVNSDNVLDEHDIRLLIDVIMGNATL